jgi:hypothetical protein
MCGGIPALYKASSLPETAVFHKSLPEGRLDKIRPRDDPDPPAQHLCILSRIEHSNSYNSKNLQHCFRIETEEF